MQPLVTDVVLEFDVPDGVVVQQSPSKIPPLFSSEQLVMWNVEEPKNQEVFVVSMRPHWVASYWMELSGTQYCLLSATSFRVPFHIYHLLPRG